MVHASFCLCGLLLVHHCMQLEINKRQFITEVHHHMQSDIDIGSLLLKTNVHHRMQLDINIGSL